MTEPEYVEVHGVKQYCSLCRGNAQREKVNDRSAYDVDCGRCGSYRAGHGPDTWDQNAREHAARMVRQANAKSLILDLSSGQTFADQTGRLKP